MEINDQTLKNSLIKNGILDEAGKLHPRLSPSDLDALMNGGGIVLEKNKRALLMTVQGSNVIKEAFNNDLVKHKNLSSAELLHMSDKKGTYYKPLADHGRIVDYGKDRFFGNPKNENTYYVTLENSRGRTTFFGNDLESKLAGYKIGDNVQIDNVGVLKKNITIDPNGIAEKAVKYDNQFAVKPATPDNKSFRTSLFEYDARSNSIREHDTTNIAIKSVNGHYLSEQDVSKLKKGESLRFSDGLEIKLSPKAQNKFNLIANSKGLLIGSLLIDGGMSFMIIKTIQFLDKKLTQQQEKNLEKKYLNELNGLRSFLLTMSEKYPNEKSILNNINIIDKEISTTNSIDPNLNKNANQTVSPHLPDAAGDDPSRGALYNPANDNINLNDLSPEDYQRYWEERREAEQRHKESDNHLDYMR